MGGANSSRKRNSTASNQSRRNNKDPCGGSRTTTFYTGPMGGPNSPDLGLTRAHSNEPGELWKLIDEDTMMDPYQIGPNVAESGRNGRPERAKEHSGYSGPGLASSAAFHSEMALDEILAEFDVKLRSDPDSSPGSGPISDVSNCISGTTPVLWRSASLDMLSDGPSESAHFWQGPASPKPLMSIDTGLGYDDVSSSGPGNPTSNIEDAVSPTSTRPGFGYGGLKGTKGLIRKKAFKSHPNLLDIGDFEISQWSLDDGAKPTSGNKVAGAGNRKKMVSLQQQQQQQQPRRRQQQQQRQQPSKVMSQDRLQELSEMPIREVVFICQNFGSGFIGLLGQTELDDKGVVLVTKVLARIAHFRRCPNTTKALLQTVLYTAFIEHHLPQYLQTAPYVGGDDCIGTAAMALADVVALLERLLEEFSSEARAKVKRCVILARKAIEQSIKRRGNLDADLKEALVRFRKGSEAVAVEWSLDVFDPNNARSITEDSADHKRNLFLGLRQCLVRWLSTALQSPSASVYRGVRIAAAQCSLTEGLIHLLQWPKSAGPKVGPTSFLPSALVFLAEADAGPFRSATVVSRSDRTSAWVRFTDPRATVPSRDKDLVLLECFLYVDDCWSAMAGLRASQDVPLPFQSYFDGRAVGLRHPAYLDCDSTYHLEHSDAPFLVLDKRNWPVAESFEPDLPALKHSLTAEIALVQSPPGSQALDFGQKFLRVLLDNQEVIWKGQTGPILVLCHSDQVLDQIVLGVLDRAPKVVRAGGRVTVAKLDSYELHCQKRLLRDTKRIPAHIAHFRRMLIEKLRRFWAEETTKTQLLDLARERVLKFDTLRPFVADHLMRQLQSASTTNGVDPMLAWLTASHPEASSLQQLSTSTNRKEVDVDADESYPNFVRDLEVGRRVPMSFDNDEFADLDTHTNKVGTAKSADDCAVHSSDVPASHLGVVWAELQKTDCMSEAELAASGRRITDLTWTDRWRLYRGWLVTFCNRTVAEIDTICSKFAKAFLQLQEVEREMEVTVLQQAQVVGMTAVAAAHHHCLLQIVQPRIVVVLEAGMISEAHLAVALTDHCQHFVAIGDHQQLKPKIGSFWNQDKYGESTISVFQSLLDSGIPSVPLAVRQQRSFSICQLLEGLFADRCQPSVPPASSASPDTVHGMDSSVFFLSHNDHPETSVGVDGSHANEYEAEFILQLAIYLLKRGYQTSQITLMTVCHGQLHLLKRMATKLFSNQSQQSVECVTVEQYHERSNDIVMLSLVRSNDQQEVGHLANRDFAYVAMTAARVALYCIGDFRMLTAATDFWKSSVTFLAGRRWYGSALTLRCVHHPAEAIAVSSPTDLIRMTTGCGKVCNDVMPCGHRCLQSCHDQDRHHSEVRCTAYVTSSYPCGHSASFPCCKRASTCSLPCEKPLPCGHCCPKKCGEPCSPRACTVMTEHRDPVCKHSFLVSCSEQQSAGKRSLPCRVPCGAILDCGHRCRGSCGQCQQGRTHVPCEEPCERRLVCGHDCTAPCGRDCPPCQRTCDIRCPHGQCSSPCGQPCVPCSEPCPWSCPHFRCGRMCFEPCDRQWCNAPCPRHLPCGHPCVGVCSEPCPPLCRQCHRQQLAAVTFGSSDIDSARYVWLEDCGHTVELSTADRMMCSKVAVGQSQCVAVGQCPVCSRGIRRSTRYGNVLKAVADDLVRIRRLYDVDPADVRDAAEQMRRTVGTFTDLTFHAAERQLRQEYVKCSDGRGLRVLDNKLRLLTAMAWLWQAVDGETARKKYIVHEKLTKLQEWHRRLTETSSRRQLEDFAAELRRVAYLVYLLKWFPASLGSNQQILYSYIYKRLVDQSIPVDDFNNFDNLIVSKLRELCQLCHQPFYETSIDHVELIDVWCMASGHWWKCPNNHIYHAEGKGSEEVPKCQQCLKGAH